MINERKKALLSIISANVIFGLNIPVTKSLITNWMTPIGYMITRMLFGIFVFWAISLFSSKEKVVGRDMAIIAVAGLLGFVATQFTFAYSLKFTTPVNYSLLMALTPVIVLLLSAIFLKENITLRKVMGIVLSFSGASLIILKNKNGSTGPNHLLGIFFAILCALCYAVYLVITRKISAKYNPITVVKWMFLFSALVLLPFGSELFDQKIYSPGSSITAYLLLGFALLFSTTLAFFLLPVALKRLTAGTVSIFMNLQPLVASAVAIFVGQDIFSWEKPLAAILVVAGVCLVTIK